MSDTPTAAPAPSHTLRSFGAIIATLEDGDLEVDLRVAIREIVQGLNDEALDRGGKPTATLTLKLTFRHDGGAIDINAETDVKRPKKKRARTVFYTTEDNDLTRQNPRQSDMFPRRVADTREVRTVG